MRKDVRDFIRRLGAAGLTVESDARPLSCAARRQAVSKANGMPFMLPLSPDTTRWRRAAIVELRKLSIDV
jgi:hypothetical protein